MTQYQRLTLTEREELSRYLAMNLSYRQISRTIGRSPSTICREIIRNGATRTRYRAIVAHNKASHKARIPRKQRKLETNELLKRAVIKYLQLRWSPEQIAKRLRILYPNDATMHISPETIYA